MCGKRDKIILWAFKEIVRLFYNVLNIYLNVEQRTTKTKMTFEDKMGTPLRWGGPLFRVDHKRTHKDMTHNELVTPTESRGQQG